MRGLRTTFAVSTALLIVCGITWAWLEYDTTYQKNLESVVSNSVVSNTWGISDQQFMPQARRVAIPITSFLALLSCATLLALVLVRRAAAMTADRTADRDSTPSPQPPLSAELEKLQGMHTNGTLTDEEYQAAKSRVLGGER